MLQWFLDLPGWVRFCSGLVFLIPGAWIVYSYAMEKQDLHEMIPKDHSGMIGGFILIGIGVILMALGGKSDSDKNGYHF
jgi:hypothetical protein